MWIFIARKVVLVGLAQVIISQQSSSVEEYAECKRGPAGCCFNQYNENGICKECPLGRFGMNCSGTCVHGYHGRLCLELCKCTDDQYCDPVRGCTDKDRTAITKILVITQKESNTAFTPQVDKGQSEDSLWKNISFLFFGFLFTVITVAGLLCLKQRMKNIRRIVTSTFSSLNHENHCTTADLFAENCGEASGSLPESIHREHPEYMHNDYAEIRQSKMIDNEDMNFTESNDFVNKNEASISVNCEIEPVYKFNCRLDYSHIPKNRLPSEFRSNDATLNEILSNSYEHVTTQSQYSFCLPSKNVDL